MSMSLNPERGCIETWYYKILEPTDSLSGSVVNPHRLFNGYFGLAPHYI